LRLQRSAADGCVPWKTLGDWRNKKAASAAKDLCSGRYVSIPPSDHLMDTAAIGTPPTRITITSQHLTHPQTRQPTFLHPCPILALHPMGQITRDQRANQLPAAAGTGQYQNPSLHPAKPLKFSIMDAQSGAPACLATRASTPTNSPSSRPRRPRRSRRGRRPETTPPAGALHRQMSSLFSIEVIRASYSACSISRRCSSSSEPS